MKDKREYQVLSDWKLHLLEDEINKALTEGWELYGYLQKSVANWGTNTRPEVAHHYCQAMVRGITAQQIYGGLIR